LIDGNIQLIIEDNHYHTNNPLTIVEVGESPSHVDGL